MTVQRIQKFFKDQEKIEYAEKVEKSKKYCQNFSSYEQNMRLSDRNKLFSGLLIILIFKGQKETNQFLKLINQQQIRIIYQQLYQYIFDIIPFLIVSLKSVFFYLANFVIQLLFLSKLQKRSMIYKPNTASVIFSHQSQVPSQKISIYPESSGTIIGKRFDKYCESPFPQSTSHFLNHTTNIIDYNNNIYDWRKKETKFIVKVEGIQKFMDFHPVTGSRIIQNHIKVEQINYRLSELRNFSTEQALYILRQMIDGHHMIQKKIGATSVSLEKCGINSQGEIKVWVNQYFNRNEISGQILKSENQIVGKILEVIEIVAGNNLKHFLEYAQSALLYSAFSEKNNKTHQKNESIRRSITSKINNTIIKKKWSFCLIRAIIKSFVQCLHLKVVKKLVITKFHTLLPQNWQQLNFKREKKSPLELRCPKNMQSSILISPNQFYQFQKRSRTLSQTKNCTQRTLINEKSQKRRRVTTTCPSTNQLSSNFQAQSGLSVDDRFQGNRHNRNFSSINNILPHEKVSVFKSNTSHQLSKGRKFEQIIHFNQMQIKQQANETPSEQSSRNQKQKQKMTSAHYLLPKNKTTQSKLLQKKYEITQQYCHSFEPTPININMIKVNEPFKSDKEFQREKVKHSMLSTTNRTSLTHKYGFNNNKCKDSVLTLGIFQKSKSKQGKVRKLSYNHDNRYKSACKKQEALAGQPSILNKRRKQSPSFNQSKNILMSFGDKKILHSCTNWRDTCKEEIDINKTKKAKQKESGSRRHSQSSQNQQNLLNIAELRAQFLLNKPADILRKLSTSKCIEQIYSYQTTEQNSDNKIATSPSQKDQKATTQSCNQKLLKKLNDLKQTLFTSTYLDSNSEKKIKQECLKRQNQNIGNLTTQSIFMAHLKQNQILQGNSWTKKLQGLIGLSVNQSQMKESISYGEEMTLIKNGGINLAMLGKLGRQIGQSVIPEQIKEYY